MPAGTGQLRPVVRVVDAGRDAWVAGAADGQWTLQAGAPTAQAGMVLMFDDDVVRVTAVEIRNGTQVLTVLRATEVGAVRQIRIPFDRGPFTGSIGFRLQGDLTLDYDALRQEALQGSLTVTGTIDGNVLAQAAQSGKLTLPETQVGIIRIPVPFTVVDAAHRSLGANADPRPS